MQEGDEVDGPQQTSDEAKMIDDLAKALYETAIDRVRQHVQQVDLQTERPARVFRSEKTESDHSSDVIIFALAEESMLDAVRRYYNKDIVGGWHELTGGNGLLATANDRMTFLFLLR